MGRPHRLGQPGTGDRWPQHAGRRVAIAAGYLFHARQQLPRHYVRQQRIFGHHRLRPGHRPRISEGPARSRFAGCLRSADHIRAGYHTAAGQSGRGSRSDRDFHGCRQRRSAPTVQWQISTDGGQTFTNIPGATSTTYTTPATDSTFDGDEYRAFFSNGIGNPAVTNAATLSIDAPPSVTVQPVSQSVTVGQTATFTVSAAGTPAPTIQWQVEQGSGPFFNISGATGDTFSFTPNLNQNGWQYRAVFTNTGGSVPTNAATLTVVAPATVADVQVNDGSAQRSEVRSITVTFSGAVSFAGGNTNAAAAFQFQHLTDGNNVALSAAVSTNSSGQTVVTLTFAGAETDSVSGDNSGQLSLADGRYALTINGASVLDANGAALDGDGDGVIGGNYLSPTDTLGGGAGQLQLFRLFGDANGDGVVDQLDLAQFRSANNSSSTDSTYLAYLDADNSGSIDQIDLGQFRQRNNSSVFGT